MDVCRFLGEPDKGKFSGSKKYSTSVKDVKRKLSCINKRINDLHHQRKFVYRNSTKVKKMVHNQINQIVKCFRARERSICSDVDEVFFSHSGTISDELSRLQSIYAHCQALFSHIENFKEKSDVLRNIDVLLSEINVCAKSDVKPLEFLSDFEMMKVKANSYGYLEGDFVKKDDFVYVDEEKGNKLSDDNGKVFNNKELLDRSCSPPSDSVSNQKSPLYKTTDSDDFQIIELLDNMNCQDIDDYVMDEDGKLNCTLQTETKLSEPSSCRSESTFRIKEYNTLKNSSLSPDVNTAFNPEEEWKQILEMNKKIASWHEMTLKETENNLEGKEKSFDKNHSSYSFLQLEKANEWLPKQKENESSEKIQNDANSTSPAEIIKKNFASFLAKDNIQDWLASY